MGKRQKEVNVEYRENSHYHELEDREMNIQVIRKYACQSAIAVLLLGGGGPVVAGDDYNQGDTVISKAPAPGGVREHRSERVRYDDLNTFGSAGIRTLYQRIDVAAKSVCQPEPDTREMVMHRDWQQCYDQAIDKAVASIALPALSRYHLVQTGRIGDSETAVTQAH
jgi:UrcA family protein